MLYRQLPELVKLARDRGVQRIAISTNGSFPLAEYTRLLDMGVNDLSISLDACCAADGDRISGRKNSWSRVTDNIRALSKLTYVTVGVVLTSENIKQTINIIRYAHELGVADIRIITAAQSDEQIKSLELVEPEILAAHPILKYRVTNLLNGKDIRGVTSEDSSQCWLLQDDSVVAGRFHFPCVIYLSEHGDAIGEIGPEMREQRIAWMKEHDPYRDPICQKNCLDVCVHYNNCVDERIVREYTRTLL
jgi:molybdenum cofactor biosynthesis enzyme MoaA